MVSFNFNFSITPSDLSVSSLMNGLAISSESTEAVRESTNIKIMSILKKESAISHPNCQNQNKKKTYRLQNKKKTCRFSNVHSIRVERSGLEKITTSISDGKIRAFLEKYGALDLSKPSRDDSPLSTRSRDPEDVKEIKEMRGYDSIRDMSDEYLFKNYHRLVKKQKYVFSQRSRAFENIVQSYIKKYENEIERRKNS